MADAEAEGWAEELIELVNEEESRGDRKLQDLQQQFSESLPDVMSNKRPSDLFRMI